MESNGMVSIIIPIYNAEDYLSECLESVLAQTYKNIEVLLVNDGSKDRSAEICRNYANRNSNMKVIHQENMGPSEARNTGIDHSKGTFLQFVGADDQLDSMMVEELVSNKTGVDLVLCGYKSIVNRKKNKIVKEINPSKKASYSMNEFMQIFPILFKKNLINSPCNKLYDSSIINDNQLSFDSGAQHGEDLLFNINYLYFCKRVKLIDKPLYSYIKGNNTSSLTMKYKEHLFENRQMILKELNKLFEKYIKVASLFIILNI